MVVVVSHLSDEDFLEYRNYSGLRHELSSFMALFGLGGGVRASTTFCEQLSSGWAINPQDEMHWFCGGTYGEHHVPEHRGIEYLKRG